MWLDKNIQNEIADGWKNKHAMNNRRCQLNVHDFISGEPKINILQALEIKIWKVIPETTEVEDMK